MDGTLLARRTVDVLADALGKSSELRDIDERSSSGMSSHEVSQEVASLFAGTEKKTMLEIFRTIPLNPGAEDFVKFLKGYQFRVVIVTISYDFLAKELASKINADAVRGHVAIFDNDRFMGILRQDLRKERVLKELECDGITLAVGDSEVDIGMVAAADIGVAYRPKSKKLAEAAEIVVSSFSELKSALLAGGVIKTN